MARSHRSAPDHLSYLARAGEQVHALGPLALLRGAEARAHGYPRIGASRLPSQDVLELAQTPSLAFPAATLDAIRITDGRPRVEGRWLGLTGPMAPLPPHLSEFASYERRYSKQQPFGGFLDVLAGRMLQLFYRSWATANPAASVDRPAEDHFGDRIAALTGAQEGAPPDAHLPARARLRYAALYASPRSPAAIQDALTDLMRAPVRIVENVPRWREVETDERSRAGRSFSTLGRDAVSGRRVRTVSDAFRVVVSVSDAEAMNDLLPGGRRYALLAEALDAFAPPHLEWDIELEVAHEAIRPGRLGGGGRLGWSGWIGPLPAGGTRSDTRLGSSARRLAQTRKEDAIA
jgi:type VI secretion system protein ImpH